MSRTLACSALFLSLFACTSASSTDIKTSGIYADITGTADGFGSTSVSATLRLGQLSTTFVALGKGDTLTAVSGTDSPHTLSKFDFLGLVSYSATLSGDEEGKSITVALNRVSPDVSAPSSTLTLPAKFQMTGPSSGTTFARGKDAINVAWNNSGKGDPMTVEVSGSCITTVTHSGLNDTGQLVISSTEIVAIKDSETKTCDLNVSVSRKKTGTLDPAYGKGGSVLGVQSRSVTVKSGP